MRFMIAIRYTIFAIFSTLLNILFQYLSLSFYAGFADLYVAMMFGTAAGLISKYIFDKKYIFYYKPDDKIHDTKKFVAYTVTGSFTTVIFWGVEISFDILFENESAKYIGAIIGLSIGYTVKYFLDKKYVFKARIADPSLD